MRLIALAPFLLPFIVPAQSVLFHFTNGTTQSFAVADIRKLTFVDDEQVLWLADGTQYAWNVSTIGQYEFNATTGIEHVASGMVPLQLQIYPNPATAELTVETQLPKAARLVVDILDLQGRAVRGLHDGEWPAGACRIHWNAADGRGARVPPGTYLVRIASPYGSSARPVVIQ